MVYKVTTNNVCTLVNVGLCGSIRITLIIDVVQ
jgi:hypothetical protein